MPRTQHSGDTTGSETLTWAATAGGLVIVIAAFAAMVYAGVTLANTLPPSSEVARDTGVFRAVSSWAAPLGLLGVAMLFAVAVPLALAGIRSRIRERRDALVTALPILVAHH